MRHHRIVRFVSVLSLCATAGLAGCKKEPAAAPPADAAAPAPKPADAAVVQAPVPDAAAAATGAHGGTVQPSEAGTLELVVGKDGQMWLYLADAAGGARPVKGKTATVKLDLPAYESVSLAAHEDHLMGRGKALSAASAVAEVVVSGGDKPETARFNLVFAEPPAAEKPHGHEEGKGHDHGEGQPHKH